MRRIPLSLRLIGADCDAVVKRNQFLNMSGKIMRIIVESNYMPVYSLFQNRNLNEIAIVHARRNMCYFCRIISMFLLNLL